MKKHFGMVAPDVEIDDGKGTVLLTMCSILYSGFC